MLQASRSTGNAQETMRPPGIKRSALFRTRDTCSSARRLDSRITSRDIEDEEVNKSKVAGFGSQVVGKLDTGKKEARARNIVEGYRWCNEGKFETRINENGAIEEVAKVLEDPRPKIHLKSSRMLEADCESTGFWEWKVDECPRKSEALSKLRNLRRERDDVFIELRSSLQNMLDAVRRMKNQRAS